MEDCHPKDDRSTECIGLNTFLRSLSRETERLTKVAEKIETTMDLLSLGLTEDQFTDIQRLDELRQSLAGVTEALNKVAETKKIDAMIDPEVVLQGILPTDFVARIVAAWDDCEVSVSADIELF